MKVRRYIVVEFDGDKEQLFKEMEHHADDLMLWMVENGQNAAISMGPMEDWDDLRAST